LVIGRTLRRIARSLAFPTGAGLTWISDDGGGKCVDARAPNYEAPMNSVPILVPPVLNMVSALAVFALIGADVVVWPG